MKKEQKETRKVIKNAIIALQKLNPQIIFVESSGCIICSSCETEDELLQLELPEEVKIDRVHDGRMYVTISKVSTKISAQIHANAIE